MQSQSRIIIFLLSFLVLIAIAQPSRSNAIADADFPKVKQVTELLDSHRLNQFSPVLGCVDQPPANPPIPSWPAATTSLPITLSRFRQELRPSVPEPTPTTSTSPDLVAKSLTIPENVAAPTEIIALADPSNYGDRYLQDLEGRPAIQKPIIVLHETVGTAGSVINFFQTYHANEDDQASYHTMIAQDGTVVYFVPPNKRAFGAGNSVFLSALGEESMQTNPHYASSVNNFAYHISLETPWDGMGNGSTHSGYTDAQYRSLAWLIAKTDVPDQRITTHKAVDRSGSRIDPRSFDFQTLRNLLSSYPRTLEIRIGCPTNSNLNVE